MIFGDRGSRELSCAQAQVRELSLGRLGGQAGRARLSAGRRCAGGRMRFRFGRLLARADGGVVLRVDRPCDRS